MIKQRGGGIKKSAWWFEGYYPNFSTVNNSCQPFVQIKSNPNKSALFTKAFLKDLDIPRFEFPLKY